LSNPENPENPAPPAEPEPAPAEPYVPTGADYVSERRFSEFPISAETLWGIKDLGYDFATPVQSSTIEAALAGRDLLVRAKTGTGKTAAFGVPLVDRAPPDGDHTFAIILAPTRELAQQIGAELNSIAAHRPVTVSVLFGGVGLGPQEQELAKLPSIVVGTPGRILDHLRRRNLDLSKAEVVVLDEADEMLSMGFYEDVTTILDLTAKGRQVMLYSATISSETQRIVQKYLKDPEQITLSTDADQVGTIEHILYETRADTHKVRSLLYLLDAEDPVSAIIFCNTREDTATVATFLDRQGLDVQLISGELSQARRTQVMAAVKAGEVRFLVSTDVAARGIDISDLSHVINYSLPFDPPIYLHRIGRTGRIGKHGKAISLVGGPDLSTRRTLESVHKIKFDVKVLPDAEGATKLRVEHQAAAIKSALGTVVFEAYLPLVRALKDRPDGDMLLAAALRAFFQWDRQRRARVSEVDSVRDLHEARAEKDSRRDGRDGRREGGRDGGSRGKPRHSGGDRRTSGGDRGPRRDEPRARRPEGSVNADDLDSLLIGGDAPAAPDRAGSASEAPSAGPPAGDAKKKRRRRKKKSGGGEAADRPDATPDEDSAEEGEGGLDDLDSLLS
jgi:ATP-dependent RNA helicase DeaD